MIDFEDVQVGVWIAEREGVEAGTEDECLAHAVINACGKYVFREARATDHEGAKGGGEGFARGGRCALNFQPRVGREDGDSKGVVEDERAGVMNLVCGAAHGDTKGGA